MSQFLSVVLCSFRRAEVENSRDVRDSEPAARARTSAALEEDRVRTTRQVKGASVMRTVVAWETVALTTGSPANVGRFM